MADRGGPVFQLETGEFPVLGRRIYQAKARLVTGLVPKRPLSLYSDADGTGAHAVAIVARRLAISEALERWAYHGASASPENARFGFDVDPSSNGMAAFPGLTHRGARSAATLEAIERHCLLAWWEGMLDGARCETRWPTVAAVVLENPFGAVVVILYRQSEWGFCAYGHAAADTFAQACDKAVIELVRHEWVLRCRRVLHGELTASTGLANVLERRSLFFALEEGHQLFLQRLARSGARPRPRPKVIADCAIEGPWTKYAQVWRFALEPPSRRFLDEDERYFFW